MTGDTTPPAVRLLAERLWKDYDSQYNSSQLTWVDFAEEASEHLKALADAGLLCSSPVVQPEQDGEGSLRSTPSAAGPDLVDAVAEVLRDFKFEVGPITLEMLKVGQAVYLTPEERHQIAHAALNAVGQVKDGE